MTGNVSGILQALWGHIYVSSHVSSTKADCKPKRLMGQKVKDLDSTLERRLSASHTSKMIWVQVHRALVRLGAELVSLRSVLLKRDGRWRQENTEIWRSLSWHAQQQTLSQMRWKPRINTPPSCPLVSPLACLCPYSHTWTLTNIHVFVRVL